MSAQTMAEVWAPIDAHYRAQVLGDTWGHLAPRKNKRYQCRLVYAVGCFGSDDLNPTVICSEFPGLEDSPWLFDAITDFVQDQATEAGCIYEFQGSFRNYTFTGKIRCMLNVNTQP